MKAVWCDTRRSAASMCGTLPTDKLLRSSSKPRLSKASVKGSISAPSRRPLRQPKRRREKPEDLELQLTLAERLEAVKHYQRSRRTFEAVLEKNPKSIRALLRLASVELDLGEREKALATLKKAWAIDPRNWVIRKQIWAVEHPDQFYPAIHTDWQREEIK